MIITRTDEYQKELLIILKYIAKDKITASKKFKKELNEQIDKIPNFPYKYRKSIYFNDENVRDMIFKKYTINYEIDLNKNTIFIFSIFNKNKLHGANIYKYATQIGCKSSEIIDFSSNINSYHPKMKIKLTDTMLVKYADSSYRSLKKPIAKKYQISKNQISLYNGATSAIFQLIKSLKQKRIYLYAPLYGEYEKAIEKDKKIYKINRFKNLYKKPKKGSIVVFVNPSTPDGRYYDLDRLYALWKKQNCIVILDESFLEFKNLDSLRNQINSDKKLYIIQSFSKFYSCAGVRIGAVFSHKTNIKNLKIPIWNISSFDAKFLTKRVSDKKFDKTSKKYYKSDKKQLLKILKRSNLFSKIYKSDSNFILTKSKKSKKIFNYLLKHKILVRDCKSFDYLSKDYLRFAVKNSMAHNKLKTVLKKFVSL